MPLNNRFARRCTSCSTTRGGLERQEIADELVRSIRAIARGGLPPPQTNPFDRDARQLEGWARNVTRSVISVAIGACERLGRRSPHPDQTALLREIAWWALWHMKPDPVSGPESLP